LIFIDDLESNVRNIILKFVDGTKVFGKVNDATDGLQLQDDFNRLCEWASRWQMEFTVATYVTVHTGTGNIEFQ